MSHAEAILRQHSDTVNALLQSLPRRLPGVPDRLTASMQYSLMAGGKRLRPALVLESARACSGQDGSSDALLAAGAIELVHTFSLVHDDLPAMDNDDLRRGKPTNHKVFGEAMAILAGDAMTFLAFDLMGEVSDAAVAMRLVAELTRASGARGMVGGQVMDMAGENQPLSLEALQAIHRYKTGALLTCACRMGAISSRASDEQVQQLGRYGQHLGLAFQIVDDILDVTSTPEQLGKATKKDRSRGKNTYPALMGLEASRAEASRQVEQAVAALQGFSESANGLRAMARFVVERTR